MDRSNVALLAGVLVTVTIVGGSFAWAFSTWLPDSDPVAAFFFGYSVMLAAVLAGIGIRSWIDRY